MTKRHELAAEQLRFRCNEEQFDFATTATIAPLEGMIGQERAVRAMQFGLFTRNPGYNIFVSGLVGTGKITYARSAVEKAAASQPVPDDWCYVNNFENQGQPIALSLPAGLGNVLRQDMEELVDDLRTEIPKVFSGEPYEQERAGVTQKFQSRRAAIMEEFNRQAREYAVLPQWTPTGFIGLPTVDGKPLTPDEFQQLDDTQREEFEKRLLAVHEKAMEAVRRVQQAEREIREELKDLDTRIGLFAVGHLLEELKQKYREYAHVVAYFEAVKQDVVKHLNDFKPQTEEENNPLMLFRKNPQEGINDRYKVNLVVGNGHPASAPVVVETNPTYYNLVGRVEYEARMGMMSTDFTMIKAGALHRANGGYLILHARDLLTNLGAWEALKRVLKTRRLQIENLGEQYGVLAMASLKPQPIPADIKVVLIGNPYLYRILYAYDEDFQKLFKVHADFDVEMDNNPDNIRKLTGFIRSTVLREKLRDFDRAAVARVIEHCCRLAASQRKLTTRFNEVVELLCEADTWARIEGSDIVKSAHIARAISEKRNRANKIEEHLQEMFAEGKLLLGTDEEVVGQVNGLAVLSVGDYMFGKPSRITANTYLGRSGIVNIERETKMSGASHTKGVLILSGYLGQKYAQRHPLAVTASITFEQTYDGIDGDSASSTELYAILSSLSGLPLRQSVAVTGSVNQKGEVQPIGGVNEKIEGFFSVCRIRGLTGRQGVLIPHQNVSDLALNDEVVEAVQTGQFHIWAVKTIDEGIEILTGVPAGTQQPDGGWTAGSVHHLVAARLKEYSDTLIRLGKSAEQEKTGQESQT